MQNLSGKTLLILGGQQKMHDVVRRAKEMGVRVIVTDWYEDSPAKQDADKAYDISIADTEAILKLIEEERVDGVFTGFIDSYLSHYLEICSRMHFHCYLNNQIVSCGTNKVRFKEYCRKAGIETIPDVDIDHPERLDYPVVIKPADNSGSKGITVCSDETMLRSAIDRAKRFSKSKQFLAEKFLVCDYVAAYYTVIDGKASLSILMDKDVNRIGRGKIPYPVAYVAPSRYQKTYLEKIHPKVAGLAETLGMKNGTFLISFFVNNGHYYAVEMAVRLTASQEYLMTGEDILGMHISYALTGEFKGDVRENHINDGSIYCMMLCFIKEGIVGKIEGLDEIRKMEGMLNVLQYRDIGASIRADGSYGQLFCRFYLRAEDGSDMIAKVENVQKLLHVTGEDGKPMLVDGFDARSFFSQ